MPQWKIKAEAALITNTMASWLRFEPLTQEQLQDVTGDWYLVLNATNDRGRCAIGHVSDIKRSGGALTFTCVDTLNRRYEGKVAKDGTQLKLLRK